ncbi:Hypothetical protein NAEGRDRAFT_66697 [Naegleria gruberi]|uniref:F-box domain-containing protein n=1 Tax=Naegleria gruberi TaxID=5762 RepID=D2VCU7_NAEGR|nr:uncharacterized protein NAEGRDRAFT_66697 [Naegleria gruberi]EFC45368.1 Hypothetical protein NAEGRDRAFT_66697 [Naegleria gruberi]|eukprot:XP_002678112.1 Hypothetical protein NAEGRDRAFT_66697 [Naegleria gruberi strain NEG-M]
MSSNESVFLPGDICFHILQFLPWKQIIACSLLSKQWRSEVMKSKLFGTVSVKGSLLVNLFRSLSFKVQNIQSLCLLLENQEQLMEFCENLSEMKSLKALSLGSAVLELPYIGDGLIQLFKCKELEQLSTLSLNFFLKGEKVGCGYGAALEIATCPYIGNLEKLIIWANITKDGVAKVASNPLLSKLKVFSFFIVVQEEELKIIYENMKHLQYISVSNPNPKCFKIITQMKEMKEIRISSGKINLQDIDTESMSKLEQINFTHTSLKSIKLLGTSSHLKNLSYISLNQGIDRINLTIEDLDEMFSGHLAHTLRYLSLALNFPRNGLLYIAKYLKNLTYLSIDSLEILNDKSIIEFTENLERESLLTYLQISSNNITELSIEYLSNCSYFNRIESLSLKRSKVFSFNSLDMVASSQFSNTIRSLEYKLDFDDVKIENHINNLKKNGQLVNLIKFPKSFRIPRKGSSLKRLDRDQQTSLVKKKKQ